MASATVSVALNDKDDVASISSDDVEVQEVRPGGSKPSAGPHSVGVSNRRFLQHVSSGNIVMALRTLAGGRVDVNTQVRNTCETALHLCARLGLEHVGTAMLLMLLETPGVDLDRRDLEGRTPLHLAVRHRQGDAAELLLDAGADQTLKDFEGYAVDDDGSLTRLLEDLATARRKQEEEYRQRLRQEELQDSMWFAREADNSELGSFAMFDGGVSDLEEATDTEDWMDAVAREYRERCEGNRPAPPAKEQPTRSRKDIPNPFERLFREREAAGQRRKRQRTKPSAKSPRHCCGEKVSADRRAADEARFEAFRRATASMPPTLCEELPWPSGPPENPIHLHPKMPKELLLSALREALRRWHPDKVLSQLAKALPPQEKAKAGQRATALAQQLTATKAAYAAHLCTEAGGS
eukprot:s3727_g2.t1